MFERSLQYRADIQIRLTRLFIQPSGQGNVAAHGAVIMCTTVGVKIGIDQRDNLARSTFHRGQMPARMSLPVIRTGKNRCCTR